MMGTAFAFAASLALLSCAPAASAESVACTHQSGKRVISGPEPDARLLYKVACQAGARPWNSGFSEEDFRYLGTLSNKAGTKYKIAFLSTIWGESGRSTNRLLIFSGNNKYLGRFSDLLASPAVRQPSQLLFPNPAAYGNTIDLKDGIPTTVWVNGETESFERATH